jgi:hypothetical protein
VAEELFEAMKPAYPEFANDPFWKLAVASITDDPTGVRLRTLWIMPAMEVNMRGGE